VIEQNGLILNDATPRDRAHILRCAAPNELLLERLCFEQNGQMVNYRANLISRLQSDQTHLTLNYRLDQEIDAIRMICTQHRHRSFVLLTDLDCLLAYLKATRDEWHHIFIRKLERLRQLETRLWALLPPRLVPDQWPSERINDLNL
jgi:hypothetical protein